MDKPLNNLGKGWDGRFSNSLVEQGVYTYKIVTVFRDRNEETIVGSILIIR